ncbi:MAG: methyltransferase domain-containing protein [Myxococcota bacterium]
MSDATPKAAWQLRSWRSNADAWAEVIRTHGIASRTVTNRAIAEAVRRVDADRAVDLGCGEGWLVRTLLEDGIDAMGVDATEELIRHAQTSGPGRYVVATYDEIAEGALGELRTDLVISNFALLDELGTARLVHHVPKLLRPAGTFLIQTAHPWSVGGLYQSGWRTGSWEGFGDAFVDPAPWYFRTLANWLTLFTAAGLRLIEVLEPMSDATGQPASILFRLQTDALQ